VRAKRSAADANVLAVNSSNNALAGEAGAVAEAKASDGDGVGSGDKAGDDDPEEEAGKDSAELVALSWLKLPLESFAHVTRTLGATC